MSARRVKVQEGENLSDANKEKVIQLLEDEKPITKKAACEILNITYNPARLTKILDEYKSDIQFRKDMRKKLRSVPIDNNTASQIVSAYLSGTSLQDISRDTYRSTLVIKNVLNKYHVPIRNKAVDYFHPVFIDNDEAIRDDYEKGDLVYSARYDKPATVREGYMSGVHGMVYTLWLHGLDRQQITQPFYELADLRKVQSELKIEMSDLSGGKEGEVTRLMYEGMKNMKKVEDKRK